jgi:hypothetical protein
MHTFDPLCVPSDLPGVNLATLNEILIYYRLMTKWSGLGDSTELSRVGLSHWSYLSIEYFSSDSSHVSGA